MGLEEVSLLFPFFFFFFSLCLYAENRSLVASRPINYAYLPTQLDERSGLNPLAYTLLGRQKRPVIGFAGLLPSYFSYIIGHLINELDYTFVTTLIAHNIRTEVQFKKIALDVPSAPVLHIRRHHENSRTLGIPSRRRYPLPRKISLGFHPLLYRRVLS